MRTRFLGSPHFCLMYPRFLSSDPDAPRFSMRLPGSIYGRWQSKLGVSAVRRPLLCIAPAQQDPWAVFRFTSCLMLLNASRAGV